MNILLITKEAKLGECLSKGFEEYDFSVELVNDFSRGATLAGELIFDIIVLDESTGQFEFTVAIETLTRRSALLVLADHHGHMTRELTSNPMVDALAKPFEFHELLKRILLLRNKQYARLQEPGADQGNDITP